MREPLICAIDKILKGNVSFALYFLPGSLEPQLISGKVLSTPADAVDFQQSGFVLSPYLTSENTPQLFISNDCHAVGSESIIQFANALIEESTPVITDDILERDSAHYISSVKACVDEVKADADLQKVVLSHSFSESLAAEKSLGQLFLDMNAALPKAFCFMVSTPESGLWMGATPEHLLAIDDGETYTSALAGTMPADAVAKWGSKEIEEQEIVTRYISESLRKSEIADFRVDEPQTITSGSVKHIKTGFSFNITDPKQVKTLVANLHPTPAVCGTPKVLADSLISKYEKHSRQYYTGYLGPVAIDNSTNLFVNLRSMKISGSHARLFVGAGVTEASVPEDEWSETEVKALTLLDVIQK